MNAYVRRYLRGKALNEDLRSLIVEIAEGGDVATGITENTSATRLCLDFYQILKIEEERRLLRGIFIYDSLKES